MPKKRIPESMCPESSTDDEESEEDTKPKINKKSNDIEGKIAKNVGLFIDLRFKDTNIHPSKDPGIIFLCRILKHFLLNEEHKVYYNRMLMTLTDEYKVERACIAKLRPIFNAIPSKTFTYLVKSNKDKEARKRSRCFALDPNHNEYEEGLRLTQRFRELLKYGAWQYKEEESEESEEENKWKWMDDGGIEDKDEGVMNYAKITNGHNIFNCNDVVIVQNPQQITMRPWVGRIMQFSDDNGDKKVMLRWFYFWNQIYAEYDKDEIEVVLENAKRIFGKKRFPPTAGDIFEVIIDDEQYTMEEPIDCIHSVVYLANDNHKYAKYINAKNIFRCNYFIDIKKKTFIKKQTKQLIVDDRALYDYIQSMNEKSNNHNNRNNNDEEEEEEEEEEKEEKESDGNNDNGNNNDGNNNDETENDDDLDLGDIKMNGNGEATLETDKNNDDDDDKDNDGDIEINDNIPPSIDQQQKDCDGSESDLSESEIPEDDDLPSDTL